MKKQNILIAKGIVYITAAFTLSGCSENFLAQDPLSFYEPTTTYTTEAGLQAALAVCDRHLKMMIVDPKNGNNTPLASDYFFSEIGLYGKTDAGSGFQDDFANKLTPTSNMDTGGDTNRLMYLWNEAFNGIKYANTVLSYIDQVKGLNKVIRNEYKGRAYFHRAMKYYNLVFEFGDVPLVTKIIDMPKQNYRSTKKEAILDMLIHDLKFAVEHVPSQQSMSLYGMVNKEACIHLLIKCYLAVGEYNKAELLATDLINNYGLKLMTEPFGTDNPGGEAKTWGITRNVIWDLHRAENMIGSLNKECIMGIPNLSTQSFTEYLTMRIFGPFWNGNITCPDGVSGKGIINYARTDANYDVNNDWSRVLGRGIATMRLSYFAQHTLWEVNGKEDTQDLRHNSKVGNWVNMENIRYNNPASSWYGKGLTLYAPEDVMDSNGNILIAKGQLLCNDTIRSWFDFPLYKIYYHDVFAESNLASTEFRGATKGSNGNMYLFRLAETYLLRAEAKLYQNRPKEAAEDVNIVRRRANCSEYYTTVNIGDIVNERARELFLEEWRKVELTRISMCLANAGIPDEWGNVYSSDWDKQSGTTSDGGSYWYQRIIHYSYYNRGYTISSGSASAINYTMDKRNVFWPIPNEAITANNKAKLAQNYGYDGYDPSVEMWDNWEDAVADESKIK